MRDQTIELPQDIDQLQFLCLQLREELIETRAAKEHAVCFPCFLTNIEIILKRENCEGYNHRCTA